MIEFKLKQALKMLRAFDDIPDASMVQYRRSGSETLEFGREQATALVEFFGGDDECVINVEVFGKEAHSGPGLYAYYAEYPDEGCILLDPPKDTL